jgi:hypothetical protein
VLDNSVDKVRRTTAIKPFPRTPPWLFYIAELLILILDAGWVFADILPRR